MLLLYKTHDLTEIDLADFPFEVECSAESRCFTCQFQTAKGEIPFHVQSEEAIDWMYSSDLEDSVVEIRAALHAQMQLHRLEPKAIDAAAIFLLTRMKEMCLHPPAIRAIVLAAVLKTFEAE